MTAPYRKKRRSFSLLRPQPSLRWIDAGLRGQIVISGTLFFTFRNTQYAHATLFITLLGIIMLQFVSGKFHLARLEIPPVITSDKSHGEHQLSLS